MARAAEMTMISWSPALALNSADDTKSASEMLHAAGLGTGGPAVVAFVGRSGSGKTTFLLKLIPLLRARHLRVALIKHSSHRGIQTDLPGTDSRRFWDVGVESVVLVTPDRVSCTRRVTQEPSLKQILAGVDDVEVVLLEGFKRSDVPKIEVIRTACTAEPLRDVSGRIACLTDVAGLNLGCPTFGLDDVLGVVTFLMDYVAA